jgi:hypothetical protein
MYSKSLRTAKNGNQVGWSKDEILAGLEYYKEQYGRFPTAHEIDAFPYLPSSRSIQRSFGGLELLRRELLPNDITNYTKGAYRSAAAKKMYTNGRDLEKEFYLYLIKYFEEIAIHEHKVIRPGQVNCDFFVYLTQSYGIVIDIFYADSIVNFINIINIKLKRYILIEPETYLVVVGNDNITQELIDEKIINRRTALPSHIKIVSEKNFKSVAVPSIVARSSFSKS